MFVLDYMGFLVLLINSLVLSTFLHYGLKYYVVAGPWSFLSKVIIGFLGAALGPILFGKWFVGFMLAGIYVLPAILGSLALLILMVDVTKTLHHHGHA